MQLMEIIKNADLTKLTTLRVVAQTDYLAYPENTADLVEIFRNIKNNKGSWNILGAGSNTLLSSRGIPGTLISTNKMDWLVKLEDNIYEAGAGLRMPKFCAMMTRESLSGTEFMEGIPGSIAGGIVMNAGAHGWEISQILIAAKVLNLETLEVELWTNGAAVSFTGSEALKPGQDLQLTYRHSAINPQQYMIISGIFKLSPDDKEEIRKRVLANNQARTSSQPIKSFTCGCTFKNPKKDYGAGKLIQDLGLKSYRHGAFVVSPTHGNFFENTNGGTSQDFCELMAHVQQEALKQKGIKLNPEVQPMGIFTDKERTIWQ